MQHVVLIGRQEEITKFLRDALNAVESGTDYETSLPNNGPADPIVFRFERDDDPEVAGLFAEVEEH